jgi:class 3 adenylate cyclase
MREEAQHPVTLAFRDGAVERAYAAELAAGARREFRIVVALSIVIWACSGLIDPMMTGGGDNMRVTEWIRYAVVTPALLAVFACGFLPPARFARIWQLALATGVASVLTSAWLMSTLIPDPGRYDFRYVIMGVTLVGVAGYTGFSLRFVTASAVCLAGSTGAVAAVSARWGFEGAGTMTLFWMFATNALGMLAAYNLEQFKRRAFVYRRLLDRERARAEVLVENMLPGPIAERLKAKPGRIADHIGEITVLFADIVGFTPLSERLPPAELVALLDEIFSGFDDLAKRHGLEKIKTIGDAYMVVGGAPTARPDHAVAVAAMALEMNDLVAARTTNEGARLALRIGIHSGPAVAGVIGKQKYTYDLWGDTVNTASRMESHGVPGEIQVTQETRDLLDGCYRLEPRGVLQIKGKGEMPTFFLKGPRAPTP